MLKDDFTCPCCVLSRSAYNVIFQRKRMFSVTLLTTTLHLINLNKSSASHFAKVTLHDFTDLHVKIGFYGGTKEHRNGAQSFYLDYCIFKIVVYQNRN